MFLHGATIKPFAVFRRSVYSVSAFGTRCSVFGSQNIRCPVYSILGIFGIFGIMVSGGVFLAGEQPKKTRSALSVDTINSPGTTTVPQPT